MERFKKVKIASILGIIGNIFLFIIKSIIGFITCSQAMIADTFNSAGDILSSLMTFIGNKIASKKPDEDHNLGHGKAEYIYSMLISVIMILTSLIIIKEAFMTLITKDNNYNFSFWLVIVCIVTILVKFMLFLYTNAIAKKHNNLLIKANSKDHLNDCMITSLNLIACILSLYHIYYVDDIVGIIISIWIIISYIKIFIESYDVLMDKCICDEAKKQVYDIVKKHPEIVRFNHFNSTPIGYQYQISLTIFVDGSLSTFKSHEIADKLEKEIVKEVDEIYLAVIHVNPIKIKDN
ncbi:MAG: cation transporter [Bacilli bacterium]|nr:cation transporter [Bacilli bacterium]